MNYYIFVKNIHKMNIFKPYKEKIHVRPYVAQFIKWYIKADLICLSEFNIFSSHLTLLFTTADIDNRDTAELPPQYSARLDIIVDLPAMIRDEKFFLPNYAIKSFDTFCHSAFLKACEIQMDAYQNEGKTRKEGRVAFLRRMEMTPDMIDEETVRRLIDFSRLPTDLRQRKRARIGNNEVLNAVKKFHHVPKIKIPTKLVGVLPLF